MAENVPESIATGSSESTGQLTEVLAREMDREMRRWRVATLNYGVTYYLSRILLIAATAVVAADQNLNGGHGSWLTKWVPALALVVAILTAIDTWLKPQQKWRGFMESRDALADLRMQAEDGMATDQVRTRFLKLRQQHRERNIF
ncbi:DUF4231 domain-containing protein [Streptomyces bluensis]|uniref:DUF4231 domain-containing protein n=1 Tax=Streptomyces bluensis TaxID=33897 RepID=A0ABW6UPC2_9ACTN|nr:hypothetical protein [Streptomyces bluensis]GGZ71278.1 hypothetical protein GCM10010344_42540 [Streptomyces bluensis]